MSKLILSGDLGCFRVEMLVRILESIRVNAEVSIEGPEKGQIYFTGGKIVGASTATDQGMNALVRISTVKAGTFSVRLSEEATRHQDLLEFPNNQAIFRHMHAKGGQTPGTTIVPERPEGLRPPLGQEAAQATRTLPKAAGSGAGQLSRVPELTDKGRIALRSIQTNYSLRGVQVEADTWRVLAKVDGILSLYQIGEAVRILGSRLVQVIDELQQQGYLRFATFDPSTEHLKQTKFRIGEYMVAKGIVTEVQLEAALRRQSELARKGRYMWLGEILVEMNYARPSQIQEAMAMQKRMQG